MLYAVGSEHYRGYLSSKRVLQDSATTASVSAPPANEVLSAHSTICTLASTTGGKAVFQVKHYLRYAQVNVARGDAPQKEWRVAIKNADAQTAQFADETEGTISAVIASLDVGSLVALDWLQVAVRGRGAERIEYPCQKLEPISATTEERLLATHPEIQILGLTAGMETLLQSARRQPEALAALHAAQKHPRALQALEDVMKNGVGAVSTYSADKQVMALIGRLQELKLLGV